jgi:hypothetical protein
MRIVASDIVTYLDFRATFGAAGILLNDTVRGDTFPNREVFVLHARMNGATLFDYRTSAGRDTGLPRSPGRPDATVGTFGLHVAVTRATFATPPRSRAPMTGA